MTLALTAAAYARATRAIRRGWEIMYAAPDGLYLVRYYRRGRYARVRFCFDGTVDCRVM